MRLQSRMLMSLDSTLKRNKQHVLDTEQVRELHLEDWLVNFSILRYQLLLKDSCFFFVFFWSPQRQRLVLIIRTHDNFGSKCLRATQMKLFH